MEQAHTTISDQLSILGSIPHNIRDHDSRSISLMNSSWRVLMESFSNAVNQILWEQPADDKLDTLFSPNNSLVVTDKCVFTTSFVQSRQTVSRDVLIALKFQDEQYRTQNMQEQIDAMHPTLRSWLVSPKARVGEVDNSGDIIYHALFVGDDHENIVVLEMTDLFFKYAPNQGTPIFRRTPDNTPLTGLVIVYNDQVFYRTTNPNAEWHGGDDVKFVFEIAG